MRHSWTSSILMVGGLLLVGACGTEREPLAPAATPGITADRSRGPASIDDQIERLIPQLFPGPGLRLAVFIRHEAIEFLLRAGKKAPAQQQTFQLVTFVLQRYAGHQLIGDQSATTQSRLQTFIDLSFQFVDLGGAPIPPGALGSDGAVAVVGPGGGTVVTGSQLAGTSIPSGAFSGNVIVTINKDPNQDNPLPTAFGQFGSFYDLQTFPAVPVTGQPVIVGVCIDDSQFEGGVPPSTLRLAHTSHVDPTTIEILPLADAPFLNCPESFGVRRGVLPLLANAGRSAASGLFWVLMGAPRDLDATASRRLMRPGGLGGKTSSFSPFGGVVFDSLLVPYGATGYRYKVVDSTTSGGGFEQPAFNDTTAEFSNGNAAFGSGGTCPLDNTVHTQWPLNSDILLRKTFVVPGGVGNVKIKIAIDNDAQVFVNGTDVTATAGTAHLVNGFQRHEDCAALDSFIFTVPVGVIHTGTNLVTVRARDRGVISFVDLSVTGQLLE
jgi:hypothetical protein